MSDYDSDDGGGFEYGADIGYGHGQYGYHGYNDYGYGYDYGHDYMDDFDDSYGYDDWLDSSSDSNESLSDDYFKWEEMRMKDSHLLKFKAVVPGGGSREELRLNSVTGGDWGRVSKMEETGGWLDSNMVVGYQDLYNLASQLGNLVTAWKGRMKQCQGDWSKEQIKKLLKARKITRNLGMGEMQEVDEEKFNLEELVANPYLNSVDFWLREFLKLEETDISVEDRMRYSVGRGMVVFGSGDSLDQLVREVYGVKNLVHKFLIGLLASTLPVTLPYPVLLSLSKLISSCGGGTKLGWISMEKSSQLVESKYVNRVYLAMLDIYNVIREIMFKHAGITMSPNFPNKFAFLRSSLARNVALLESFHQLTVNEEPEMDKIFYKEFKTLKFKLEPSKLPEIGVQKRMNRDRMVVSGDHIFIVHAKGEDKEAGLILAVHHLETGEIFKQFTAVPLSILSGEKLTLCTGLCVLGDLVAVSLSLGYPKISPSSSDEVFVVNWVEETLVMRQNVPHSSQLLGAVREREEVFNHSDGESDSDHFNSSYGDDHDMVNSYLRVALTKKNDHLYLLHSELVLPEMEYISDLANWGQHIRIWGLQEHKMLQELNDVRVLDLQDGLVIYEEAKDKCEQMKFSQFNDFDVVVRWLDLLTGKEIYQESFLGTGQTSRPVFSIARNGKRNTMVLQYLPGQDTISLYTVDVAGTVQHSQQVAFPALTTIGAGAELKIQLLSENLINFSHKLESANLKSKLPEDFTRCVIAMAGSEQLLAEVFIPNASDYHDESSSTYHTLAPADRIVQEGDRLVLMEIDDSEIENEREVSVWQYEFQKPALEVINWDEDNAKEIVEKVKTAQLASEQLSATKDALLDVLAMNGKRTTGSIVKWCGSFGFLKLHEYPNAPNVFIHISDIQIRKRQPLITAGIKMEVSLEKDFIKNKVKAVAAKVLL